MKPWGPLPGLRLLLECAYQESQTLLESCVLVQGIVPLWGPYQGGNKVSATLPRSLPLVNVRPTSWTRHSQVCGSGPRLPGQSFPTLQLTLLTLSPAAAKLLPIMSLCPSLQAQPLALC